MLAVAKSKGCHDAKSSGYFSLSHDVHGLHMLKVTAPQLEDC